MAEVTLRIDGMHCGSCIRRVTQAIGSAGSVEVKEVRLGAARFEIPESQVSEARPGAPAVADSVIAALAKAGFKAQVEA